jgi:signal transduction histidine kinase
LVAARSAANAAADTHQAWLLLAGLAAAVMLAAGAAALVVARGLSRPLEVLAASARRLGLGDFSVRAPRAGVSEVDAVAEALDATADRLGAMVAREREFSADASHQLRTPLTALRIDLEEAELRGAGAEPASALRQVDRLEQTIDTLLAAARGADQSTAEADLVAIAEELEGHWRPQLAGASRRLRLELPSGDARVAADDGVVREILQVLLENAARHGRGTVTLAIERSDGWLRVVVKDEGPGFGDEGEAAFERVASPSGHGIGLSLARSLAHAAGGSLSIVAPGPSPAVALVLRRAT